MNIGANISGSGLALVLCSLCGGIGFRCGWLLVDLFLGQFRKTKP